MEPRYGPISNMATTMPIPPPTIWEETAVEWHRAREGLQNAQAAMETAAANLRDAEAREQKAWANLENVSGRNAPKAVVGNSIR